ncbi:P-loop containing nucleoside triphosphate hydrolase protein [Parachaetomium inaequale]|uniref:P-loop containing nucleoside triphosphate hydrolase protein n=1 Tax=Parachaetomium inaequale TaxID=2588326 RepID=A0AAN6PJZ4_9PEZI|nr:P-loop containing nucleoside triphosphate hydrolase protein [Parachaetomium inaequale]
MSIVTATPPDSDTEVIVSVDETASVSAAESVPVTPTDAEPAAVEENPPAETDDNDAEQVDETAPSPAPDEAAAEVKSPQDPPVHKLYRHQCRYDECPARWAEFAVLQDEQDNLEAKVRSMPIVQRYTYSKGREWVTQSFAINCQHMRAFLSDALADYQDLDIDLEGWSFTPPYKPLVHRWERALALHQQLKASDDVEKTRAADKLIEFLEPLLAPSIRDLAATHDTGRIRYDMIWQIFPPGEMVLYKLWGVDTLCRVVKYRKSESRSAWRLTLEYVYWDGEKCGLRTTDVNIPYYTGLQRVTSLRVYPLSFAENPEQIKEAMMARGRRFQQLRGYHFLSYDGTKVPLPGTDLEQPMNGRVIIDTYAYYESNNYLKPEMRPLGGNVAEPGISAGDEDNDSSGNGDEEQDASDDEESMYDDMVATATATTHGRVEDLTELSDEHCLLTTPWLKGFDLKAKAWARFHIDKLSEIEWNDKAFDNLVLPGGEKELAWEFVASKTTSKDVFDDFVPDKGRGIIILMFGPPGVGKTYTAEAVAEKARVPLYLVSAGMLGTSPDVVEPALDHALELCRMWNAMLLLDEADVFLGARLDDSLARNELIAIFLTKLEYYQGILFLTTNRFSRIDHAFQSRVDLFLPYHNLGPAARKQVWQNFLGHFGQDRFDVSAADLDRLSALPLNGREIKNLLKSAQLLNSRTGGRVTAERLYMLADKRVSALKMLEDHNASVGR